MAIGVQADDAEQSHAAAEQSHDMHST